MFLPHPASTFHALLIDCDNSALAVHPAADDHNVLVASDKPIVPVHFVAVTHEKPVEYEKSSVRDKPPAKDQAVTGDSESAAFAVHLSAMDHADATVCVNPACAVQPAT